MLLSMRHWIGSDVRNRSHTFLQNTDISSAICEFVQETQQDATAYQNLVFHQHASGYTPPIIRSLKLHYQPLILNTWRVVGRVVAGRCAVAHFQAKIV